MNKHITAFKQYLIEEKKSSNNTVESYIMQIEREIAKMLIFLRIWVIFVGRKV